jgi:histidinol-phosphate aminotransferase
MSKVVQQCGLDAIKPYVPGKNIDEVKRELGITDIIKLASNENPLGPSPLAQKAVADAIGCMHLYPDGQNYNLRAALAKHYGIDKDYIFASAGGDGIIVTLCMAFLDQGSEAIISRTSFPEYDIFINAMRARIVKTPLKNYGIDLEATLAAITERTKIIIVCNPNNPTGTILSAAEIDSFLARVPENILVILDEAYHEYVMDPSYPDGLDYIKQGMSNLLVLRTFSKAYGLAGVRVGYAFACPDVLASFNKVKASFNLSALAQVAGIAALDDQAFVQKSVDSNNENRQYLCEQFDRLGLFYVKSHANFLLVEVGPNGEEVFQALLRRGVIVRPCAGYELPRFLRITIGTREQNERLIAELEKILPRRTG